MAAEPEPLPIPPPGANVNPYPPGSAEWRDFESRRAQQDIHGTFGRNAADAEEQRRIDAESLDPNCPADTPYKSRKEGGGGACVEYPDNCPDGMTAYGANQCISASDPRAHGGGPGGAATGPGGEAVPKGLGELLSSGIWNRVADTFNLGMPTPEGATAGSFTVQGDPRTQAVGGQTRLLKGGGLLWGGAGGWGSQANPAPAAPTPAPQFGGQLQQMLQSQKSQQPVPKPAFGSLQEMVRPVKRPKLFHTDESWAQ